MKGTINITVGNYGGFYFVNSYTKRICLGFIALTYYPFDMDELLQEFFKK